MNREREAFLPALAGHGEKRLARQSVVSLDEIDASGFQIANRGTGFLGSPNEDRHRRAVRGHLLRPVHEGAGAVDARSDTRAPVDRIAPLVELAQTAAEVANRE